MRSSAEYSIDLGTEELLKDPTRTVTNPRSAESSSEPQAQAHNSSATDDAEEIELTPEEIDALLSKPL